MTQLSQMLGLNDADPVLELAREMVRGDRRFIDKLIEIRQRTLTQTEMAERMGVSQSAVAKFETGNRDPKLSTIRRYALALGVAVSHSIAGEDCSVVDEITRRETTRGFSELQAYLKARSQESDDWEQVIVPRKVTFDTSAGPIRVKP